MTLSQSQLSTEIQAMVPTAGAAEMTLAVAFGEYMKEAIAAAVPIIDSAIDSTAVPAMASAMSFSAGASAAAGAAVVRSGIDAFWAAMVAVPASFFATATLITPPVYAGLSVPLAATFVANAATSASLADSADDMAADIHPLTSGIGTATFPGPIVEFIA